MSLLRGRQTRMMARSLLWRTRRAPPAGTSLRSTSRCLVWRPAMTKTCTPRGWTRPPARSGGLAYWIVFGGSLQLHVLLRSSLQGCSSMVRLRPAAAAEAVASNDSNGSKLQQQQQEQEEGGGGPLAGSVVIALCLSSSPPCITWCADLLPVPPPVCFLLPQRGGGHAHCTRD